MLFKDYVGCVVASIVMLVLGGCMALIAILWNGQPLTAAGFFTTWAQAFTINYLAALILPAGEWGNRLCAVCKLAPGKVSSLLLSNLITTFVYVTIVSLGMTLLAVGTAPIFWGAWWHVYPILFGAGYVVAFLVTVAAVKIAVGLAEKAKEKC